MKLLIVGFNARPIAKSAMEAGHSIGVIDYFGDMDLLKLTKNCFSVLRQKPGNTLHRPLHRKPSEYMYILSEIMCDEQGDFDGIILGSSFDPYPEIIAKFNKLGPKVYANNPSKFELIRNKKKINSLAQEAGFSIPKLISTNDYNEVKKIAKKWGYPIVTREDGGGGGVGIKLWLNESELKNYFEERKDKTTIWIQEYIKGVDASASVVCSKNNFRLLSLNKQLIGDKKLRAPGAFSYCGNIVPLESNYINREMYNQLKDKIKNLFSKLNLVGTNGIDFVIKNDKFYFMEINPRFQGSLECIQYATGINIVKAHLDSFNDNINYLNENPKYKSASIKGILFSDNEKNFQVKKYPDEEWIVDRTHFNVILEKTDPFCSIVLPTNNIQKDLKKVYSLADKILKMNKV